MTNGPLRAVGLISGGLDSTVVAAYMQDKYDESHFVFCDYGQKTLEREHLAFKSLCDFFRPQEAHVVDMRWLRKIGNSALFEESEKLDSSNRKREYVPFRNACLLTAAVAVAETVDADSVLIGSTGGDTTCPDNSPSFLRAFQSVITEGTMTERDIMVTAPLIELGKKEVIELGLSLDAPFELSWSCHNNLQDIACGVCSNCDSRVKAFDALGLTDPIAYE